LLGLGQTNNHTKKAAPGGSQFKPDDRRSADHQCRIPAGAHCQIPDITAKQSRASRVVPQFLTFKALKELG
jgi:hypothetical protein